MAAQKQENRAVKMKNTHNYRRKIKKNYGSKNCVIYNS